MNYIAILAAIFTWVAFGALSGYVVLGVGFLPDPGRTALAYVLVFGPFLAAGLVLGYLANNRRFLFAAALSLVASVLYLILAPAPVAFFGRALDGRWVPTVQAAYQLALSVIAGLVGTRFGVAVHPRGAASGAASRPVGTRNDA